MGCKRYDGCIICVLFQISWQLQTHIVKNRILSDSLFGNKLYWRPYGNHTVLLLECRASAFVLSMLKVCVLLGVLCDPTAHFKE